MNRRFLTSAVAIHGGACLVAFMAAAGSGASLMDDLTAPASTEVKSEDARFKAAPALSIGKSVSTGEPAGDRATENEVIHSISSESTESFIGGMGL